MRLEKSIQVTQEPVESSLDMDFTRSFNHIPDLVVGSRVVGYPETTKRVGQLLIAVALKNPLGLGSEPNRLISST